MGGPFSGAVLSEQLLRAPEEAALATLALDNFMLHLVTGIGTAAGAGFPARASWASARPTAWRTCWILSYFTFCGLQH